MPRPTLIWDGVVRSFHLVFGVGFLTAYVVAVAGGHESRLFPIHAAAGLVVALAAAIRVLWLVVGPHWSRLSGLSLDPRDLLRYFGSVGQRRVPGESGGHNPATSWTLLAMLGLAGALAFTGISLGRGNEAFEEIHPILAHAFLAMVALHVVGALLHAVLRRDGILLGMVDGRKAVPADQAISSPHGPATLGFWLLTSAALVAIALDTNLTSGRMQLPLVGTTLTIGEADHHEGGREGYESHEEED